MNVLRISTAGSVDDGKSTLIGRLLFDTNSLAQDQKEAIEISSKKMGTEYFDFSLATDGLIAEREQGITIDVAHIYFSTPNRKYIIADTPGHVEYTRNMVTGASTSNLSIILIDARKGVIEQTYRHFYITTLLRIPQVVVCVNKMDLVNYSEDVFQEIKETFSSLKKRVGFEEQIVEFIPISALQGENIVSFSEKMKWHKGKSLLDFLEKAKTEGSSRNCPTRFPVQYVIRPKQEQYHDFRGYTGTLLSGTLHVGEEVAVFPSQTRTKVKSIELFEQSIDHASASDSIAIQLEDDVDISRGNMISATSNFPLVGKQIRATVCWMQNTPLKNGVKITVQHGVNNVLAKVLRIHSLINPVSLERKADPEHLDMNDIGAVEFQLAQSIFYDLYESNKKNGAFILIDNESNNTAGVGFIKK